MSDDVRNYRKTILDNIARYNEEHNKDLLNLAHVTFNSLLQGLIEKSHFGITKNTSSVNASDKLSKYIDYFNSIMFSLAKKHNLVLVFNGSIYGTAYWYTLSAE